MAFEIPPVKQNTACALDTFSRSNAVATLVAVQPTASLDLVEAGPEGKVRDICALGQTQIWINGGFFAMRNEIFCHIQPGEELVREPFRRLMEKQALLAYKNAGFWQFMDTFKDKQRLEDLNQDAAPWKVWEHVHASKSSTPELMLAEA